MLKGVTLCKDKAYMKYSTPMSALSVFPVYDRKRHAGMTDREGKYFLSRHFSMTSFFSLSRLKTGKDFT